MPQLVVTVKDQSYLANLRRAIKSLEGVERVTLPRQRAFPKKHEASVILEKQLLRLDELAQLPQNWDDDGALPMEMKSVNNVRRLLKQMSDYELKKWILFPDVNGTILMESKELDATVSIGNADFSYVSSQCSGNHVRLTTKALLDIIHTISS